MKLNMNLDTLPYPLDKEAPMYVCMKERNGTAQLSPLQQHPIDLPLKYNRYFECSARSRVVQIPSEFFLSLFGPSTTTRKDAQADSRGSLAGVRRPGSLRHKKRRNPALTAGMSIQHCPRRKHRRQHQSQSSSA
jgi:hypothetical protein